MRYYTKEWYALMQRMDCASGLKKIPDQAYTEAEIRTLYEKAARAFVAQERRAYNRPPDFPDLSELFAGDFNPEDWLIEDETGELRHPVSAAEARASLERDQQAAREQFEHRPAFDADEAAREFASIYRSKRRFLPRWYPAWMGEAADVRLLALGLAPESVYVRLKAEDRANRAAWRRINRAAERALARQDLPEDLQQGFPFHDAALLSFRKAGRGYVMTLRQDGGWPEDVSPYARIVFEEAEVVENDALRLRTVPAGDGSRTSNVSWLYHELYRTPAGYELHMLFWRNRAKEPLAYLTVRCRDLHTETNVAL